MRYACGRRELLRQQGDDFKRANLPSRSVCREQMWPRPEVEFEDS